MSDLNLGAFKAYDIRTKITNLTDELKLRLYNAVVAYVKYSLKASSVVICHDARLYVSEMAEDLTGLMRCSGINVFINPQPISTCQFYHSMMKRPECAGIMLTASHNPKEYVGMKLMAQDLVPLAFGYGPDGGVAKIKDNYINDVKVSPSDVKGRVTIINDLDSFIDYSLKLAGLKSGDLKGERIMLEFLSGSSGNEVALAFQETGADLVLRHVVPNGFFPAGDPNPIIESSIAPTRKAIVEEKCNFGFCFDGDGDRLDLIAPNGSQIVPGYNMSILIPELVKLYKPYLGDKEPQFYADVKAIPAAVVDMAQQGVGVHIIRNGHSFIKAKLRENYRNGYIAAEEESAHYYINLPYDINDFGKGAAAVESTLFYSLLTAKCYHENPEKYAAAQEKEQSLFRKREWPLHCEKHPEIMQELMDRVENTMKDMGANVIKSMEDGSDLDAVLMRFNLPETFDKDSSLNGTWVQVAERISRSEDAMVRWEVASNDKKSCDRMDEIIHEITDEYVLSNQASY